MAEHPRIVANPAVMMGKPVVKGTRITVEHILRCLAAGETPEEVAADYPPLTIEDIRAAQGFAADHVAIFEREVDALEFKPSAAKTYMKTFGVMPDDAVSREAVKLGAAYRKRQPKC